MTVQRSLPERGKLRRPARLWIAPGSRRPVYDAGWHSEARQLEGDT
jgi:hypothetical protein